MEHTGIEAILNSDDPTEKRLALRSRAVEPFHLRIALQDEDPEVRLFVAQHPSLTPALITEIINGDDRWLASRVLHRPDITPELLEQAAKHEDLHLQVARHPAITPEIKSKLLAEEIPSGLRNELEKSELSKNIGHLLFPGLGLSTVKQKSVFYPSKPAKDEFRGGASAYVEVNARQGGALAENRRFMRMRGKMPTKTEVAIDTIKEHFPPLDNPTPEQKSAQQLAYVRKYPVLRQMANDKVANANEHHEVQHGIFAEVAQKYGFNTRDRLITHLLNKIPWFHRNTIDTLFSSNGRAHLNQLPLQDKNEEKIAYLTNYLMDPHYRQVVHGNLGILKAPHKQRELQQQAKEAWRALQHLSQTVTPPDIKVLGKKTAPKKQEIAFADPKQVLKSEDLHDSLRDHLGFDGRQEDLLEVARILTGKDVDYQVFRARLTDCDDEIEAIQQAAGLEPDSRNAIENLLKLKSLKKSQRDIQVAPLAPNAVHAAEGVRYAAAHNQIESVKLSGKHSAGTLLARDGDDVVWLLKPGSGNQSPAAGAGDDPASQSRREAAFFAVSRMLGILDVPEAYLLQINGKEVACIKMLGSSYFGLHRLRANDPGLPRRILKDALDTGLIFQWSVVDYVLGNTDRHGNNLIVGPEQEVALIDHGSAFAGVHFDPGHDSKSFVPYYLRIWGPDKGWSKMDAQQRLAVMPILNSELDEQLRDWILAIDAGELAATISSYGIDPAPSVGRLNKLQEMVRSSSEPASKITNALWVV